MDTTQYTIYIKVLYLSVIRVSELLVVVVIQSEYRNTETILQKIESIERRTN